MTHLIIKSAAGPYLDQHGAAGQAEAAYNRYNSEVVAACSQLASLMNKVAPGQGWRSGVVSFEYVAYPQLNQRVWGSYNLGLCDGTIQRGRVIAEALPLSPSAAGQQA